MPEWTLFDNPFTPAISTTEFVQDAVTSGIAKNQEKSENAVKDMAKLVAQIGSLLNSISEVPTITAELGSPTTPISSFSLPAIPTAPAITGKYPSPNVLNPVVDSFPTAVYYSSSLLAQLQSTLMGMVTNSHATGLNPVIEQQLWDRARERTQAATQGVIEGINRYWARSGWNLPQGAQAESIYKAMEDKATSDITESRNIAVAQAELEQKNVQFSITQAVALEELLGKLFDALQQRAIEIEKERIAYEIEFNKLDTEVYKTQVSSVTAEIEGLTTLYKVNADVYASIASAESEQIKSQVAVRGQEIDYLAKKADLSIETIKSNIATFIGQKELILGTLKTIVQVQSQLAASFGSAVNYSAGISANEGKSISQSQSSSFSNSISESTTHQG